MSNPKTVKEAVRDMLHRLSASDEKRARAILREKAPALLTDEHAALGDHRHDAIPPPEQREKK